MTTHCVMDLSLLFAFPYQIVIPVDSMSTKIMSWLVLNKIPTISLTEVEAARLVSLNSESQRRKLALPHATSSPPLNSESTHPMKRSRNGMVEIASASEEMLYFRNILL